MVPSAVQKKLKEAYKLPFIICLFLIPIFILPSLIYSFTEGKELLLRTTILISVSITLIIASWKGLISIKPIWQSSVGIALLAFFGIMLMADALSPTPLVTIYGTYSRGFGLITMLFLLATAALGSQITSKKDIVPLLRYAFAGGAIVALYALIQKTGFEPIFRQYDTDIFVGRVFSFLGNPGYLGQLMALNFILGIFLLFQTKKRVTQALMLGASVIVFLALYFSETRTAFLALFIAGLLSIIKSRKIIVQTVIKTAPVKKILIVLMGTSLVAMAFFGAPKDRFSFSSESIRSLNSRIEIWNGAINLISKKPWFGYGGETFYIYFPETVTKQFLTLEEDVNLSADRIHNELLETTFAFGIFGGIAYLMLFAFLIKNFFSTEKKLEVLSLIVISNMIQNQFSFSDISISALIYFCLGAIIANEIDKKKPIGVRLGKKIKFLIIGIIAILSIFIAFSTIYKPLMSHLAYTNSKNAYTTNYETAVNEHKKALSYTPYYSELWYELMLIDPSSMPRALDYLEKIEGESGNVLAWKGNMYAESEPEKASEYYMKALEKNPQYPNWIRSYADLLYKTGDHKNALFLYKEYLNAVPDFWTWFGDLENRTAKEQQSYKVFFKHVPQFWNTVERVQELKEVSAYETAVP